MKPRTVADALRLYRELELPRFPLDAEPLDKETMESLRVVKGYTNPELLACQLAAGLRTLWTARQSGENPDDDTDATICLLAEVASLLEHAIEAHNTAAWWLGHVSKEVRDGER